MYAKQNRACEERDAALDRKLKDPRGLVARKAALAYLVQKMCSLWNGKQKILNWGCFCQYGFMSQFIEGIEPIYIEYLVRSGPVCNTKITMMMPDSISKFQCKWNAERIAKTEFAFDIERKAPILEMQVYCFRKQVYCLGRKRRWVGSWDPPRGWK